MKLATLKDGSRDGQLAVVSRDLAQAHFAAGIATRLHQLLDDWNFISPQLEDLYATLNGGKARHAFAFDPRHCMAPLPRAYQRVDGCAYPSHHERLRQAGVTGLPDPGPAPLLAQRHSDSLLGPCDDALFADEAAGIDFGGEVAVVTGDVAAGTSAEAALDSVRLLLLANDWTLREPIPADLADPAEFASGRGPRQPATAFAPVAVTPDELGDAWRGGRLHLELASAVNGRRLGRCNAGDGMQAHFGQLIAQLAGARRVGAGCIVGGGTVSHADAACGTACIAEKRALELLEGGVARTGYLRFGDHVRIEITGGDGLSVFGAVEQVVAPLAAAAR
jgi:fumarylacetoacetate (FAA) hydrolase